MKVKEVRKMKFKGMNTVKILVLIGLIIFSFLAGLVKAADIEYPTKPVTLVVGHGPGGGASITAHIFAEGVKKYLTKPQPFIVFHKEGATGLVGVDYFLKEPQDGYTLDWFWDPSLLRMALEPQKFSFTLKDFIFLGGFAYNHYSLAVSNESPFKTFEDFSDYAKKNPGVLTYSTTGIGSGNHIAAEVLMSEAGFKLTHVPFKSGNDAALAMLGGHVSCTTSSVGMLSPYIKSGKARVLMIFDAKRSHELPDVPTAKEKGYDVLFFAWNSLIAGKGTPKPVLDTLAKLFKQTAGDPTVQSALIRAGWIPLNLGPEETEKKTNFEFERASKIFEKLGLVKK
jgi:tripartite-type tricarboxylate transporter receptor subunit TctC